MAVVNKKRSKQEQSNRLSFLLGVLYPGKNSLLPKTVRLFRACRDCFLMYLRISVVYGKFCMVVYVRSLGPFKCPTVS